MESPSDNKKEILIVFNDITKRIQAEEALKKQNAIYQALIDNSFDGIDIIEVLDWDQKKGAIKGKLIARNQPMEKFLRSKDNLVLNKEDILAISPTKFPDGKLSEKVFNEKMIELLQNGLSSYDWQLLTKKGEVIDLEIIMQYILLDNQIIFIRIAEDVTEKKKAEQKLKKSQQRYQNFLDTSPDGIVVTDMHGTVTYASPHIKHLYGYDSNDDFYGRNTLDFVAEEHKEYTLHEIGKILDKGEIRNLISKVTHRNGSNFYLESNIKLLYDDEGKPNEMLFVQRDVTDKIKQQEILSLTMENLNEKNAELKKYIDSNMELENFAYIASHDLQAPIRSIISFTQLLGRSMASKLDTEEQEYLDFVVTASRNMKSLIDDLLSYSRVNTNAANFTETNVKTLIAHSKLELQAEVEARGAQINLCAEPPETIIADKVKLKQLLQNLISNGLKFAKKDTPPVISIDFQEKKNHWYFSITDNGIGIKEEFQEKIFLIFQRLHTNQEYEGTGIGLAICKKIAEQHGGKLGVKSEYGTGSQFYFTISKKLQPSVHAEKV
jgi:PAS domain S-box-containing protein